MQRDSYYIICARHDHLSGTKPPATGLRLSVKRFCHLRAAKTSRASASVTRGCFVRSTYRLKGARISKSANSCSLRLVGVKYPKRSAHPRWGTPVQFDLLLFFAALTPRTRRRAVSSSRFYAARIFVIDVVAIGSDGPSLAWSGAPKSSRHCANRDRPARNLRYRSVVLLGRRCRLARVRAEGRLRTRASLLIVTRRSFRRNSASATTL